MPRQFNGVDLFSAHMYVIMYSARQPYVQISSCVIYFSQKAFIVVIVTSDVSDTESFDVTSTCPVDR